MAYFPHLPSTPTRPLLCMAAAARRVQVGGLLCKGGAASPNFDMASLAPMLKDALADGAEGLAAALDGLLGGVLGSPDLLEVGGLAWCGGGWRDGWMGVGLQLRNPCQCQRGRRALLGTPWLHVSSQSPLDPFPTALPPPVILQNLVGGIKNGTLGWGSALDELLASLLASPAGNSVADGVSDLLNQLADWLNTPVGGGGGGGGGSGGDDDKPAGGDADKPAGDDKEPSGDVLGLGSLVEDILGAIGLGGQGIGNDGGIADGLNGIVDTITGLIGGLTGGAAGNPSGAAPGDLLNQLVATLTGGADSPLAGVDLTNLLPVLSAVVKDDAARAQLPALIGLLTNKGGQPDLAALGPVLAAITKDPEASKQLPTLLDLVSKLGINLG